MPNNPICPLHHVESVLKPAGVSKGTGKRYQSFFACPEKDEDGGWCQHKFTERPPVAGFGTVRLAQSQAAGDKDRAIKYMNALKIASELIAAGTIQAGPDWKETLEAAAAYVYRLSPPADRPAPPEEINRDEIPF